MEIKEIYKLIPRYDNRISFYGKAQVIIDDKGNQYLQSYDTIVAKIIDGKLIINGWYNNTTGRHINEFLLQNVFEKMTKKEMEEYTNDR